MKHVSQTILVIALTAACSYGLLGVMASMSVSATQIESVYVSIHGGK